jgi:ankyrin repeat protein
MLTLSKSSVNSQDERGNTALHLAAGRGLILECMSLIQTKGADFRILNHAGLRPKDLAMNLEEQYLTSTTIYGDVIEYLDRVERDCGREFYYFSKDNYDHHIMCSSP